MRIVFFSDVHANLPALEAVLDHIQKERLDMVFCLGDLVSYAPWPNEVVEAIRKRNIACIAGNHDEIIGGKQWNSGKEYVVDRTKSIGQQSIEYTNSIIHQENRDYLSNLPRHLRFFLGGDSERTNFLLVHGSPEKIDEYLSEDLSDDTFHEIFDRNETDFLFFGHTHKPFHKELGYQKDNETFYRHAINTGSVGKPKDGDPRACYVILTFDKSSSLRKSGSFQIEFKRVEYDVEKAAVAVEESLLPNEFADMLRKAY